MPLARAHLGDARCERFASRAKRVHASERAHCSFIFVTMRDKHVLQIWRKAGASEQKKKLSIEQTAAEKKKTRVLRGRRHRRSSKQKLSRVRLKTPSASERARVTIGNVIKTAVADSRIPTKASERGVAAHALTRARARARERLLLAQSRFFSSIKVGEIFDRVARSILIREKM